MFDLGTQELIVIFVVAFLVFGPKKLPELGRTIGKVMRELKSALHGVKESLEEAESGVGEELKKASDDLEESVRNSIESHLIQPDKEDIDGGTSETKDEDEIIPASAIEKKEETEEPYKEEAKEGKSETDKDG